MKKILLVGSHSCSNRGDMAILRGLVQGLKKFDSDSIFKIYSREFESSDILYRDHTLSFDTLHGNIKSFKSKILSRMEMILLFFTYLIFKPLCPLVMSRRQKKFFKELEDYDFVIQVGGSFLVDSYGPNQFEYILLSILKKKKIYLLGHSYGPFRGFISKLLAKSLLKKVEANFYRESESKKLLDNLGIKNLKEGADTAWLVPSSASPDKSDFVALTLRDLYPFDKVLGVTQKEFEENVALLIDGLNENGIKVKIFSSCTGFGGYWKDDRVIGFKVKKLVKNQEMVEVILDELDDIELGKQLSKCKLTIGTRLHSAIISMNFGTPAYTIYYEHKSLGVIERVLNSKYCLKIQDLNSSVVLDEILKTINNITEVENEVNMKVIEERKLALKMIESIYTN